MPHSAAIPVRLCYLALWAFLFSAIPGYGQVFNKDYSGKVKLESSIFLTKKDGLPSNSIRSFAETDDGFIWLGTGEGICRFDGTRFKTYTYDPADSTSIYDRRISKMVSDSHNLYIGTHLGFSIMDRRTEKFKNYQFENFALRNDLNKKVPTRVSSIEKARNGEIWMGTFSDAVFRYIPHLDSFRCYKYPVGELAAELPIVLSTNHILCVEQDRFNDSLIWAGTTGGLLQINAVTHEMKWFLYPEVDKKTFVSQNAIRSIYQHHDGLLYLASWHAKANIFDPKTSQFYPLPIQNKSAAERAEGYQLLSTPVNPIFPKNDRELWIPSIEGLMTYDTETKSWTRLQWNELKKERIYGIGFIDSKNRVWQRSNSGLHLFDPVQQQFIEYDYEDFNPDLYGFSYYFLPNISNGNFAVMPRSADGIYSLDGKRRKWEKTLIPKKYRGANGDFIPYDFSLSLTDQYTIVGKGGVFNFHRNTKKFTPLPMPIDLQKKSYRSTLWDSRGNLWIGAASNDGLVRWAPNKNIWAVYKDELLSKNTDEVIGSIRSLFEDSQKNIWINRKDGFSVYETKKDTFYNFVIESDSLNTVTNAINFVEDKHGRVWINSHHGLLSYANVLNPEQGIIQKYDLFASDQLTYLLFLRIDANGMLWGLTDEHLCQIDPNEMQVTKHSIRYGVKGDRIYGFDILADGKFVLGGKNKIWLADPKDFLRNPEKATPYLTEIAVLQEPLLTDKPLHFMSTLELDHSQNFFSFGFSSIGFTRGIENKFRYRLKGFEDKWTETSDRRFANFTNVPSGDYLFELQAANNEGDWNEQPFNMDIHVATPWWKTYWFGLLALMGLISFAYLLYKWRIGQVRKEERLRSDYEQQLATMEMSALRAQMNPHFIFNSLNSIEYFIISNEPDKASDYLNRFSRLIRLILQNSKSSMVPLKDDLDALKLYIEIESMRFDDLFDYEVQMEKKINGEQVMVPPLLLQPYIENAIWHGLLQKKDARGQINLTIRKKDDCLLCIIEDNGIGRAAAQELKSKTATKGKSFGMKITRDRLDALNELAGAKASVKIIDLKKEGGAAAGTRVELVIPL